VNQIKDLLWVLTSEAQISSISGVLNAVLGRVIDEEVNGAGFSNEKKNKYRKRERGRNVKCNIEK
jgi:hypothetical protein